jgi:hypothetical protein
MSELLAGLPEHSHHMRRVSDFFWSVTDWPLKKPPGCDPYHNWMSPSCFSTPYLIA